MIESGFPILEVSDLERAMEFYSGTLGGEVTYRFTEVGEPVSVSLSMGSAKLGIGLAEDAAAPSGVCSGSPSTMSIHRHERQRRAGRPSRNNRRICRRASGSPSSWILSGLEFGSVLTDGEGERSSRELEDVFQFSVTTSPI